MTSPAPDITTLEQADAVPVGTTAIDRDGDPIVKTSPDTWAGVSNGTWVHAISLEDLTGVDEYDTPDFLPLTRVTHPDTAAQPRP